jgi:hypothetical protein
MTMFTSAYLFVGSKQITKTALAFASRFPDLWFHQISLFSSAINQAIKLYIHTVKETLSWHWKKGLNNWFRNLSLQAGPHHVIRILMPDERGMLPVRDLPER